MLDFLGADRQLLGEAGIGVGPVEQAALALAATYRSGGQALMFGNGGSAAQSQHFAAELVVRIEAERTALPAVALTTDSSVLTAIANDYGFERVFSRQIEALGRAGRRGDRDQHQWHVGERPGRGRGRAPSRDDHDRPVRRWRLPPVPIRRCRDSGAGERTRPACNRGTWRSNMRCAGRSNGCCSIRTARSLRPSGVRPHPSGAPRAAGGLEGGRAGRRLDERMLRPLSLRASREPEGRPAAWRRPVGRRQLGRAVRPAEGRWPAADAGG